MKVAREDASTAGALIERKAELLRLANRCESEEPSPQLDRDIWLAAMPVSAGRWQPCTTSIDAAVTLVPEGAGWIAGKKDNGQADGVVFGANATVRRQASTPALALCAAALRARAQEIA